MPEYRVQWELVVDADDERAAASKCWDDYFVQGHLASVFEVQSTVDPLKSRKVVVDLGNHEPDRFSFEYTHQALHAMAKRVLAEGGDADEIVEMLARPWKWNEVLTEVLLDSVPGTTVIRPETPDLSA